MPGLASKEFRDRQLAGLAPLLSFSGLFIQQSFGSIPVGQVASVLLPFLLFLFLRSKDYPLGSVMAVRTADLAFSVIIMLLFKDLLVILLGNIEATSQLQPGEVSRLIFYVLIYYFIISLVIAFIQSLRGKAFKYPISFRMSEKILLKETTKEPAEK